MRTGVERVKVSSWYTAHTPSKSLDHSQVTNLARRGRDNTVLYYCLYSLSQNSNTQAIIVDDQDFCPHSFTDRMLRAKNTRTCVENETARSIYDVVSVC